MNWTVGKKKKKSVLDCLGAWVWAAVVLGVVLGFEGRAQAIEFFCNPVDICAMMPTDGQGQPAYNHTDPNEPWVIGGNETVSLAPGEYSIGMGPIGVPMIFVVENGTLAIENNGTDEVGFGAWVVLCDQATFRIHDATFRSLSDFPFQNSIFALGESHIDYQDANIYALKEALHTAGAHGALFQVMGESSTLNVAPGTLHGVEFPAQGDAWELAVVHQAQAYVQEATMFGEFYIQGEAQFEILDTEHHDLFFELCPGDDYTLTDLPPLCDLTDPATGCFTDDHPPLNFSLGPPDVPFTLSITNTKVFSWALSSYPGTTATVQSVPKDANFAIGLGGIHDDLELFLDKGASPVYEGLTDRSLSLQDAHVLAWHVWPVGTSHTVLLPGSRVGDLLPGDDATAEAHGVTFADGMVSAGGPNTVWLEDSELLASCANAGGNLGLINTTLHNSFTVGGPTWMADMEWPDPSTLDLRQGGTLHAAEITAPATGALLDSWPVEIRGNLRAEDPAGPLSPFPAASLVITQESSGVEVARLPLQEASQDDLLYTWSDPPEAGGTYVLSLYFDNAPELGGHFASVRTVTVPGGDEADGGTSGGDGGSPSDAGADGGADAGGSGGSGGSGSGSGCGCVMVYGSERVPRKREESPHRTPSPSPSPPPSLPILFSLGAFIWMARPRYKKRG